MLTIAHKPDVLSMLPLAPVGRPWSPADFQDLPYAPALILEYHGDALILAAPEYQQGCEDGFHSYFDEMLVWNESGTDLVFRSRFHTHTEVVALVVNCIVKNRHVKANIAIPFSFSVGF